jgi:perosamine synthetase
MTTNLKKILPRENPPLKKGRYGKIVPVCEPKLAGNELKYVTACIKSNWISSAGHFVAKFENAFKKFCGTRYAVACSSGTAALHLALAALGIQKGDEVIIPDFTMIATPNAATYLGAKPVPVDADPLTWNIDVSKIESKITRKTRAIVVVHTYGLPCDMDKILSIARKHHLFVVEDAAEAHGATYKGKRVGNLGDIASFSFYGNKIITTGEGGMVTTNKKALAEKTRTLRDHAFSPERHFWHKYMGYNYRMTNLQAAVGLAQAEKLRELVRTRIRNAKYYIKFLKGIKGIRLPYKTKGINNVYWMFSVLIEKEFGISRDRLREFLAGQGIETRTFFIPIHLQPIYSRETKGRFPVSEELCRKGIYLPSGSTLTRKDIRYIAACVKKASR